jgi:hypothetical protein
MQVEFLEGFEVANILVEGAGQLVFVQVKVFFVNREYVEQEDNQKRKRNVECMAQNQRRTYWRSRVAQWSLAKFP